MADRSFVEGFDLLSVVVNEKKGIVVRGNVNSVVTVLQGQKIVLALLDRNGRLEPMLEGELTRPIPRGNLTVGFFIVPDGTMISREGKSNV